MTNPWNWRCLLARHHRRQTRRYTGREKFCPRCLRIITRIGGPR